MDVSLIGVTVDEHDAFMRQANALIDQTAHTLPDVTILDPLPYLSRDGFCFTENDGRALYYDRQHITHFGASFLEPMFADALSNLIGNRNHNADAIDGAKASSCNLRGHLLRLRRCKPHRSRCSSSSHSRRQAA